nr:hypothetical protein [Deinococcus hopiensis]
MVHRIFDELHIVRVNYARKCAPTWEDELLGWISRQILNPLGDERRGPVGVAGTAVDHPGYVGDQGAEALFAFIRTG